MKKPNLEKLQQNSRKRYGFPVPDLMATQEEREAKTKAGKVSDLKRQLDRYLVFLDAQVGEKAKKIATVKDIADKKKIRERQKKEDREDICMSILKKRVDHSERSDEFYTKRPPAVYSNTSPYGIAQQMLQEQLNEENSFRFAKKRKF